MRIVSIVILVGIVLSLGTVSCYQRDESPKDRQIKKEKTAFQTAQPWKPTTDVRADIAIVYGVRGNPHEEKASITFEQRVQSWRDKGYVTHFMTGIAWGEYQDYFTGKWDGKTHFDEGQVEQDGDTIWHGWMVPYIVPSENFIEYMKKRHIKRVIDAGIDAIYLEEPEFWARAGYSEAFKKEWKDYYGFDWRPQHESAGNTYLSNKLKYHLYYKALNKCFTFAKEYGKSKGIDVRCYVPTHSLINYSQWQIVSPEASLASLPCVDGYIAQVWTGTSRTPNYFNGVMKERVFETAFLEYGCMESMTAPTGRKVFFLTDPIEDRPRDWEDYKKNYQATFSAQLFYPSSANYEVMPWPDRIYEGLYQISGDNYEKRCIPRFYSTQMQVMINSLNDMPISENKVSGSEGISVLMANSLMFQQAPTSIAGYDDPQLSNFYGLVLPFLKRGIPIKIMHLENVSYPESWEGTHILLMSYSSMKPLDPEFHRYIADWVKDGGHLVFSGSDADPFQQVQEWWNTGDNHFRVPSDHLFELLGIESNPQKGIYSFGKGKVYIFRDDPKTYLLKEKADEAFVGTVKQIYEEATQSPLEFRNYFYLERGAYDLVSVLDESVSDDPFILKGILIDLFDPTLPILTEKQVFPGEQAYLYDIHRIVNPEKPQVLATAARVYEEMLDDREYSFVVKSPIETTNVMRIWLPAEPEVMITNKKGEPITLIRKEWDALSKTCLLSFENDPEGIHVSINW